MMGKIIKEGGREGRKEGGREGRREGGREGVRKTIDCLHIHVMSRENKGGGHRAA